MTGFASSFQVPAVLYAPIPDTPISTVAFSLNGPDRAGIGGPLSGKLLQVASPGDASCLASSPAKSTLTPNTGTAAVNLTQNISVTGC